MIKELESIENLTVYETSTNFILLKIHKKSAQVLKDELLRYGNILIRDASNFIGLDDSFVRVAIKSHEDNKVLIDEMRKLLGS